VLTPETLTEALERASAGQSFVPNYDKAVERSDQLRLRRRGTAVAATIAAITCIAVGVSLAVSRNSHGSGFTVMPAPIATASAAPITVLATLSGVSITWLPKGYRADPLRYDAKPSPGASTAMQDFASNDATTSAANRLSLTVIRGATAAPVKYPTGDGVTTSTVTVRGHSGQLVTAASNGSPEIPDPLYILQWTEQKGLVISVAASFGASLADVQRMAAGLIVHDVAVSTPKATDDGAVRAAFADAYTSGEPASTILGAIENGQSLTPVLASLKQIASSPAKSTHVALTSVTFHDADHATGTVSLDYVSGKSAIAMVGPQDAIRVNGQWKVTRESYCRVVAVSGITCPAE
jgi:hypothetical protein